MSLGGKRLISKLEGIVFKHIYNNGNRIRYPLTFDGDRKLKGKYMLKVTNENAGYFFSGRYVFGANELYIYDAISDILLFLEDKALLDVSELEDSLAEEGDIDED